MGANLKIPGRRAIRLPFKNIPIALINKAIAILHRMHIIVQKKNYEKKFPIYHCFCQFDIGNLRPDSFLHTDGYGCLVSFQWQHK